MAKFWMVVVPQGGQGPTKRHESYEAAEKEAGRIAHKQSTEAFVLESVARIEPSFEVRVEKM